MPDAPTLALFAAAVARGLDQGRAAALVSVLGIQAGAVVHVAAAALGLSSVLASSAVAFSAVKYAGAAYLIYLGVRTLLDRSCAHAVAAVPPLSLRRVFVQAAVVNILNPKTALFFLAFLPQFVDPDCGAPGQILLLGGLFMLLGLCTDGAYALLSGALGGLLRGNARFLRLRRYASGGTYLALGVATAVGGPPTSD